MKLSQNTHIDKRTPSYNILNGNIFGNEDLTISFKNGIKSVNLENYKFTNFLKSTDKDYIRIIRKEFNRLKNNNINILEEYNDKPIGMTDKISEKLENVHYETYFYRIKLPFLKRITKIHNERLQLYYYLKDDNSIEIIFIDFYHLLIPAADHEHNEKDRKSVV